jgi:hypothetical protein
VLGVGGVMEKTQVTEDFMLNVTEKVWSSWVTGVHCCSVQSIKSWMIKQGYILHSL